MSSHQTIVKNTLFLYFRMFLIMGISLYTSRVVLQQLGVSDYGIYSLVGGIVTMLGFFNAAMSSATQRYLSFDIGKNDEIQLQKTFSATLTIHIGIAVLVLILAETIGLWYINNKMIFPRDRLFAVNIVYQFSVLTFLLNIIQVPYNALIIARERMNIYAYVSILETSLKLAIVFLLVYGIDKLILYAVLTFIVSLIIRLIYQIYCRKHFKESKYKFEYNKAYYKELISYSGWNLFGNVAAVSKGQGINLVLNIFFGVVVNTAYGITNQVVSAVNLFATNLQMAFNPQIIKNYSQEKIEQTQKLIFQGSKISFFLILLLIMPILLNTEYILMLWLKEVPVYTVRFLQLALIGILIDSLSGTLMTGVQATGKIKWYQIIVGTLVFINLPLGYLVLKLGFPPYSVFLVSISISIISLKFRLFFLKKKLNINLLKYYNSVFFRVLIIVLLSFSIIYFFKFKNLIAKDIINFILQSIVLTIVILILIFCVGLNTNERLLFKNLIKNKLIK